jgi:fructose-bisphosphate aldolase class I
MNAKQLEKIRLGQGFFAALDQSGGSTPAALARYGIEQDRYGSDVEMFDLVHAMRTRVVTSPGFTGARILAVILFEQTMRRAVNGLSTLRYLWEQNQIVPFLKVDKGLAPETHAVALMKPIDTLDDMLDRARQHAVFGTKMRSLIKDADPVGVTSIVEQQFDYAVRIWDAGLIPILEPEVSITSPHKSDAELLLLEALQKQLVQLPDQTRILFKLTIPTHRGLYADLASDPRVLRVLALSGGYSRAQACELLARDPTMIASFSRAPSKGFPSSKPTFSSTIGSKHRSNRSSTHRSTSRRRDDRPSGSVDE